MSTHAAEIATAALDTKEGVAARVREVTAPDVTHIHVSGIAARWNLAYDRLEPVYEAGRAALTDAGFEDYSAWTAEEHYAYGICWQWIHLLDGRRIALTYIA